MQYMEGRVVLQRAEVEAEGGSMPTMGEVQLGSVCGQSGVSMMEV